MASKIIRAASGHTMCVTHITAQEFEALELQWGEPSKYTKFYKVQNWDTSGPVFMYLAKGYHTDSITTAKAAREVHGWYAKGKRMWSSMGDNLESAINGMQRDGWLCA